MCFANMKLSELELHFLHQIEEAEEDLFLFENEVRLHFCKSGARREDIVKKAKESLRSLYSQALIELVEIEYKEIKPNHYEPVSQTILPDSAFETFLDDESNWEKEYSFKSNIRCYLGPTEKGIKTLDVFNT